MSKNAFSTLSAIAGWADDYQQQIQISGATDPVLPTSFKIAEVDFFFLRFFPQGISFYF